MVLLYISLTLMNLVSNKSFKLGVFVGDSAAPSSAFSKQSQSREHILTEEGVCESLRGEVVCWIIKAVLTDVKSIHMPKTIALFHKPLHVNHSGPFLQSNPKLNSRCTVTTLPVT
jgi:hypothetical protein